MKVEKPVRGLHTGEMLVREFYAECNRVFATAPSAPSVAYDLFDVMRTTLYVVVSVPAYALVSLLFAAALYIRVAGALLLR